MGQRFNELSDKLADFIRQQKIFFVATAPAEGHINLSPKGMDTLRVLTPKRVLWLNVTGSGNETAAHLLENNRITIMLCAFEGDPLILRLYGRGRAYHPRDLEWPALVSQFPSLPGARQVIDVDIELVQTSCGMAVPFLDFKSERDQLQRWAEKKGFDGIRQYWEQKNQLSLDGKPTNILES